MTQTQGRLFRTIVTSVILALIVQSAAFAQEIDPARTNAKQVESPGGVNHLPDSPGTVRTRPLQSSVAAVATTPDAQAEDPVTPSETPQTSAPSQSTPLQQPTPHEPVGTAAAESIPVSGIAASRPAGAAVAPAKQRRVRSILIKVGAVVGIGVAVGTTVALSQGSPSKPPGSR